MSTAINDDAAGAASPTPATAARPHGHTGVGRLVLGSVALLAAIALVGGAVTLTWALETHRDGSGYFTTAGHHYQTSSYALSTQSLDVGGATGALEAGLAKLRIRVMPMDAAKPLFVGIARTDDVDRYLARVQHDELRDIQFDPFKIDYNRLGSGAPTALPSTRSFWQVRTTGAGTQTLTWPVEKGRWTAVVMNADGSRDVSVHAQLAARLSGAWWFVSTFLALGVLALVAGVALVLSGVRKRASEPTS